MPYIFKHIFRHAHLIIFIVYFYIKALYIFTWVMYVYIYKKYTATSMFKYMLNQGGHMSGKTRKSGKKRMWHIYVHIYFVHMYGARNIHATYMTHVSNHALSNTWAATKCYICNIYFKYISNECHRYKIYVISILCTKRETRDFIDEYWKHTSR